MDYPFQIPGTTGPQIIIRPGPFDTTVLANGVPLRGRGSFRKTYAVPMPDGSVRELSMNTWTGRIRARVDGTETPIGPQLSIGEMIIAFLPIGLVAVGGMLGGVIGGAAVGVNLSIARGNLQMPVRLLGMLGTTVAAAVAWFVALMLLRSLL